LTKTINDVKIEIKKQFRETANLQQNVFEDIRIQRRPSLIVVPISLIHNWENEIMKFSPFLKILKYRGNKRERKIKSFDKYDVIITGYGIVRNDIDLLCEYQFLYVILDESQFIKNPTSQAFKAVKQLKSDYKLVLTGTPVENSLSDLWSQMDFLNEGILGNFNFFKDNFINIIEKNNDDQRADRLKKMIQPFILRRTKDEVAKDLPALNEQTVYCEMSEEHTKFYESEKSKIRNKLLEQIETGAFDTAIPVLQALTQLRQAANHPKLIEQDYEGDSGKFGEVILDIENLIAENHKILIFSSFVKHLKLFVEYFEQKSYKYSLLTGKTTDREKVIDEFQSDPENRIFLISIKAGGTGLNLTQADYVMILDPWWNIAVELQAVNRAHRIGQDKKVMVYRYISKKTVEEKIQKLQEKKLILAESFITTENPLKNLSKENLISLFE
jgi:SNF2 family DNA or RNA helicase